MQPIVGAYARFNNERRGNIRCYSASRIVKKLCELFPLLDAWLPHFRKQPPSLSVRFTISRAFHMAVINMVFCIGTTGPWTLGEAHLRVMAAQIAGRVA